MNQGPSFNAWTIVFLIAAVHGLFVALVLLRLRRGNIQANRLLAIMLVLFSITLFEYVLYWTRYLQYFPGVAGISEHFPFLFGPLLLWYLKSIYTKKTLQKTDLWQLAPFLLFIALFLPWYLCEWETKKRMISGGYNGPMPVRKWLIETANWARIAHLIVFAVLNYRYIRKQSVSDAAKRWGHILNLFFIGFALAYTSYFVLVRFQFFSLTWDYHISAAMTAFIYLIAYSGYMQPAVFEGFKWTEPIKYKNSGLTKEASKSLFQRMTDLMETDHLYRDPEISLDKLSAKLGAGKHHVSQVINEHVGGHFFDYINHWRVEEVKKILIETTRMDMHVIEAAYSVGFNNKVSFNTAFKKETGMTPTEYRRSHAKTDTASQPPGAVEPGD